MVQGKTKGMQSKVKNTRHAHDSAAKPKKGKRTFASKKPSLIKQAAIHKKLTAKINKSIEQQMVSAASSGKLTIMKNTMPDEFSSAGTSKSKK